MILNVLSNFLVEEAGGKALPLILDVRDEQQVKSVVQNAVDKVIIALDFFREFFFGTDSVGTSNFLVPRSRSEEITEIRLGTIPSPGQPVSCDMMLF